jgi:chromate transporter
MVSLIGYAVGGIGMAALATAAMFVPAALVMYVTTRLWTRLPQSRLKAAVTGGLAPVIIGLVWSSVFSVGKGVPLTPASLVIIATVAALALFSRLSAPLLILGGGAAGLIVLR